MLQWDVYIIDVPRQVEVDGMCGLVSSWGTWSFIIGDTRYHCARWVCFLEDKSYLSDHARNDALPVPWDSAPKDNAVGRWRYISFCPANHECVHACVEHRHRANFAPRVIVRESNVRWTNKVLFCVLQRGRWLFHFKVRLHLLTPPPPSQPCLSSRSSFSVQWTPVTDPAHPYKSRTLYLPLAE
jgi:hypothetical protein